MVAGKENTAYSVGNSTELRKNFVNGPLNSASLQGEDSNGNMALVRSHGKVKNVTDKIMLGYDDIYSIQYFGTNLRPYWNLSLIHI